MDFGQVISNINFLAVIVAAFSAFFVGWIWYGPLFGKKWMVHQRKHEPEKMADLGYRYVGVGRGN